MFPIADDGAAAGPSGLSDYLGIVRRRALLAIVVFAVVVGLGAAYTLRQPAVYSSSVKLGVRVPLDSTLLERDQSVDPARSLRNEIEFITSDAMATEVEKTLKNPASLSVEANEDADVVEIVARGEDPELVAKTANTYAQVYKRIRIDEVTQSNDLLTAEIEKLLFQTTNQINELNQPIADLDRVLAATPPGPQRDAIQLQRSSLLNSNQAQLESLISQQQSYRLQLDSISRRTEAIRNQGIRTLQEAGVPSEPEGPGFIRNLLLLSVLGAMFAFAAVLLAEHFDDSIKTTDTLRRVLDPVLGVIPQIASARSKDQSPVITLSQPHSAEAESYRSLRTSVQFIGMQQSIRIIQVTSPMAGEGKSMTASNLGVVLARAGDRVLLVSADLRRPSLEKNFGIDSSVGITSVLLGEVAATDAIVPVPEMPGLYVLPTGVLPPNPSELLAWQRTEDLIRTLGENFNMVIVDSPPVVPITDALVSARFCDATIVVARSGRTSRRRLHQCIELLQLVEANVVGSVLNGATAEDDTSKYGYSYDYRAGSGPRSKDKSDRASPDATPMVSA